MRWFSLGSLVLLTACGAQEFQSQKLADGSYRFQCELPMDECIRRAQETCRAQRYRILEGTSETRLRDAPPFEQAYHTSRLHLKCSEDNADVLLSIDKKEDVGESKNDASAATKPSKVCSAGETRACVGAGACQGGQACLPDGTGFGTCDCAAPAPIDAAPASTPLSPSEAPTSPADAVAPQPPAPASPPTP